MPKHSYNPFRRQAGIRPPQAQAAAAPKGAYGDDFSPKDLDHAARTLADGAAKLQKAATAWRGVLAAPTPERIAQARVAFAEMQSGLLATCNAISQIGSGITPSAAHEATATSAGGH